MVQIVKNCQHHQKFQKWSKLSKIVRSCLSITLIICLKGHKSLGSLFEGVCMFQNQKCDSVSQSVSHSLSDNVTYWAVRFLSIQLEKERRTIYRLPYHNVTLACEKFQFWATLIFCRFDISDVDRVDFKLLDMKRESTLCFLWVHEHAFEGIFFSEKQKQLRCISFNNIQQIFS